METALDRYFASDLGGGLHRAVDSPPTQMSGRDRRATVQPGSITFPDFRCLRDTGNFATSRADPDRKTVRVETSGVRLRTVRHPANSGSDAVHLE